MRGAIEGAVRCIAEPVDARALMAAAVDAVLGPDAPPIAEQRRRARQRALDAARAVSRRAARRPDDDEQPRSVHLTRLEHAPVRDRRCPSPTR